MRAIATVTMLAGLLWLAFWIPQIVFWGAKGTLPLLAFVGGLLAIAGSLAYLAREEHRLQARISRRLLELQQVSRRNGHSLYSLTYPNIPKPYQRRAR